MKRLYSILLIVIGSFLEIYYYSYRFTADGINIILAVVIGVGLTALLNSFFIFKKMTKGIILWAAVLIVYSIISTSAGQSMSLTEKQITEISQVNDYEIENLEQQISFKEENIQRKKDRYAKVNEMINNSISSLEDKFAWGKTLPVYEEELDRLDTEIQDLNNEISDIQDRIVELKNPVIELDIDKNNIYYFYYNLIGANMKWSQFILQTILSAFIASMAPFGIRLLRDFRKTADGRSDESFEEMVRRWISVSWVSYRAGKGNVLLDKKVFSEWMRRRNVFFPDTEYDTIYQKALRSGVVKDGKIIITDEQKAFESIINGHNRK